MHAERDYLVKRVFPELREWCEQRRLHLVDIDLRWGVTEAEATNKNTLKICLTQIDKARPFFLCFLGQRRGWVPEIEDIAKDTCDEFPELKGTIGDTSITEMEILHAIINPLNNREIAEDSFFYFRDPAYVQDLPIHPRLITKTYTNEGSYDLIQTKSDVLLNKKLDFVLQEWKENKIPRTNRPVKIYQARWDARARTPELALPLHCPFSDPLRESQWRNLWNEEGNVDLTAFSQLWFHSLRSSKTGTSSEIGLHGNDLTIDADLVSKGQEFNNSLCAGRLTDFSVGPLPLAEVILGDLKNAIRRRFPNHVPIRYDTPLQKEIDQQGQFLESNCIGFIPRIGDFDDLSRYIASNSGEPFIVTGPAGIGKTMLLANWIRELQKPSHDSPKVFYRFIGASDEATTVDSVLRSLLNQIKEAGLLLDEVAMGQVELQNTFHKLLNSIQSPSKVVIVIDSLNQLDSGLSDIAWIPRRLPKNVKLVVSFKREGDLAEKLVERLSIISPETISNIKPFESLEDRRELIDAYLKLYLKKLDDDLVQTLINLPGAKNPLFLKIILSELRTFGSYLNIRYKINNDFGETPLTAFIAVFRRLENDPAFSAIPFDKAVPILFGFLSHARAGLTEQELVALFSQEQLGANDEDRKESIHLILRQVRPFIAIRNGRFDFFYDIFKVAAQVQYQGIDQQRGKREATEWHRSLAIYFDNLPEWISREKRIPMLRRTAELPFHLAWADKTCRLAELFLEKDLLDAVVFGEGPFVALRDIEYILSPPIRTSSSIADETKDAFRLIQTAIRQSVSVFIQYPDHLASQLHGRLIGSGNVTIDHFLERMRIRTKGLWLRPLTASLGTAKGPLISTLTGHSLPITALALTSNDRYLVSGSGGRKSNANVGSEDGELVVWDLESGRRLHSLIGHTGDITAVAVTPDGLKAISASSDRTIKIWDLIVGQEIATLTGHTDEITAVAVTPNGQQLISASGYKDKSLKVWDLASTKETATIKKVGGFSAISVTPDGRQIVTCDLKTLKIWDINNLEEIATLGSHMNVVKSIAISSDGNTVISGSSGILPSDGEVKVWDLQNRIEIASFGDAGWIKALALTFDGRRAIIGCEDIDPIVGKVKIIDLNSGHELATLTGHLYAVTAVAVCSDDRRIVSGSKDSTLKVWDMEKYRDSQNCDAHREFILDLSITPDGRRAVSASSDTTLKVWDLASGSVLHTLRGHTDWVRTVTVTPDSRCAVSGSSDKTLKVWDLETGQELATLTGHSAKVLKVALTPDGRLIISGSEDATLKVWDLEGACEIHTLHGHIGDISTVSVLLDGYRMISGSEDATIKIWNLRNGKELFTLAGHTGSVEQVVLTPDGHRAISGSNDKTLKVWDLENGKDLHTLIGHTSWIRDIVITPDGQRAVSASDDHTLKVWDLVSECELYTLRGHTSWIFDVAVTPDAKLAISVSEDRSVNVWDLTTGTLITRFISEFGIYKVAFSSASNIIIAGDRNGNIHILKLENYIAGPSIITGRRDPRKCLVVYQCPYCAIIVNVEDNRIGKEVTCCSCGRTIKLNPFFFETRNRSKLSAFIHDLFHHSVQY